MALPQNGKSRGATGTKQIMMLERTEKAMSLRRAGMSYEEIRKELGVSRGMAFKYVERALEVFKQQNGEECEKLRSLEVARIDRLHTVLWGPAMGGDLSAIDRITRLLERRAKLLGLDAPVKTDTNFNGSIGLTGALATTPSLSVDDARRLYKELQNA